MAEDARELDALREAIDAFAAERAPDLAAEAAAEAVAKVRSMLADAIGRALLDRSAESLRPRGEPRPRREVPPRGREPPAPPPTPRREEAEAGTASDEPAYYVYGVAGAGTDLAPELRGVDPRHPVELIEEGGLAAIASRVSLREFGEEPLHDNLNDLVWLEEKARAHERVLDEALAKATVVPLRLCTIYRDENKVRAMLREEGDRFADALRRLAGKSEWGVKVIAEPGALEREAGSPPPAEVERDGVAYLNRKRDEARAREEADLVAERWAEAVHARLTAIASEAQLNPPVSREASGRAGEMLMNGVYLVADPDAGEFRAAVDELDREYRSRGASVELTGPWPAYNFVAGPIEAAR